MKVAFNARFLTVPNARGIGRYIVNLMPELIQVGVQPVLLTDMPIDRAHEAITSSPQVIVRQAPPMRYARWLYNWTSMQCRKDAVALLHALGNFGLPWRAPCPMVLTLHDAIDKAYPFPSTIGDKLNLGSAASRLDHWVSRNRCSGIITVSECSRRDIIYHYGVNSARIRVIYEAAAEMFFRSVPDECIRRVRQRYNLPNRFILYVGGWELRKNLPFLVRAFAAAQLDDVGLVLAGGKETEREAMLRLVSDLRIVDRVLLLGWIPDKDLPAIYAEALLFAYPSEYEGFGLQSVEAMACGCPVLAARTSCLPEIVGTGGQTFSVSEPSELIQLMQKMCGDAALARRWSDAARRRAMDFSWRVTALKTFKFYREMIECRRGS